MVFSRSMGAVAVRLTAPATPPLSSFATSSFVNVVSSRSRGTVYSDSASSTNALCTNLSNAAAALAPRGSSVSTRSNSRCVKMPSPS